MKETETLIVRRKTFFAMANDAREYLHSILPTDELIEELHRKHVDIFSFLERKWCCPIAEPSKSWSTAEDNIAILHLQSCDEWWKAIGKKTRNMIRKAEKSGIKTEIAVPNDRLAEGIWRIFNETPIRQERGFPHYGTSLGTVKQGLVSQSDCTYIGAYFQNELAGFINLIHGEKIAIISQILSLQKHWDKAVNNSLVAKAIEVCANQHIEWIMYGRIGNHPSLDIFKENNGFSRFPLTRYYIPLTRKGKIALALGLHRELKDALPQSIKYRLIPIYNWISRTKMRIRLPKPPKTVS
jgi:hypothetical protein